jgi:hypothetical protein
MPSMPGLALNSMAENFNALRSFSLHIFPNGLGGMWRISSYFFTFIFYIVPCVVNNGDLQVVVSILIFILITSINTLYVDKFVVQKTFPVLWLVPCVCVINCVITGSEPQLSSWINIHLKRIFICSHIRMEIWFKCCIFLTLGTY